LTQSIVTVLLIGSVIAIIVGPGVIVIRNRRKKLSQN
jgi:hypothetical protein